LVTRKNLVTKKRIKVIYVAGSMYSGSTILSLILGSDKKVFYTGELVFSHLADDDCVCVCGKRLDKCPFWSKINKRGIKSVTNPSSAKHSDIKVTLSVLNPFASFKLRPSRSTGDEGDDYGLLVERAYISAKRQKRSTEYILDSSKQLYPLYLLFNSPKTELYVIHLVREGVAVADSFKKRDTSLSSEPFEWFTNVIFKWIGLNTILPLFFRRAHIKNIRISYSELCQNPEATFRKLNRLLGTGLDVRRYKAAVQKEAYHNLGGNAQILNNMRPRFASFEGIKNKNSHDNLSKAELLIAKAFLTPFNAWLLKKK
jgi:hypothetical protein